MKRFSIRKALTMAVCAMLGMNSIPCTHVHASFDATVDESYSRNTGGSNNTSNSQNTSSSYIDVTKSSSSSSDSSNSWMSAFFKNKIGESSYTYVGSPGLNNLSVFCVGMNSYAKKPKEGKASSFLCKVSADNVVSWSPNSIQTGSVTPKSTGDTTFTMTFEGEYFDRNNIQTRVDKTTGEKKVVRSKGYVEVTITVPLKDTASSLTDSVNAVDATNGVVGYDIENLNDNQDLLDNGDTTYTNNGSGTNNGIQGGGICSDGTNFCPEELDNGNTIVDDGSIDNGGNEGTTDDGGNPINTDLPEGTPLDTVLPTTTTTYTGPKPDGGGGGNDDDLDNEKKRQDEQLEHLGNPATYGTELSGQDLVNSVTYPTGSEGRRYSDLINDLLRADRNNSYNANDDDWYRSDTGSAGDENLDGYFYDDGNGGEAEYYETPYGSTTEIFPNDVVDAVEGVYYEDNGGTGNGGSGGDYYEGDYYMGDGDENIKDDGKIQFDDLEKKYKEGLAGLDGATGTNSGILGAIVPENSSPSLSSKLNELMGDRSFANNRKGTVTDQELYDLAKKMLLASGMTLEDIQKGRNYDANSAWTEPTTAWDMNRITTLLSNKRIRLTSPSEIQTGKNNNNQGNSRSSGNNSNTQSRTQR